MASKASTERITQAEFARRQNVTRQAVNEWVAKGVIRLVDGKLDPEEALAAIAGARHPGKAAVILGEEPDRAEDVAFDRYHAERSRLTKAQADHAELTYAERCAELVPLSEVQDSINEAMAIIASQDDGLAGRLAAELADETNPAVIRQRLLEEIRANRAAAAQRLADWAGLAARRRDSPAAADPDA